MILYNKDSNDREISINKLEYVKLVGTNLFYPNCQIYSPENEILYRPINENIMSLMNEENNDYFYFDKEYKYKEDTPLFFFIYNTDNYYHFVYDTLPYLISFQILKKNIKDLKLLMNFPNFSKKEHYKFVLEFLQILDISIDDIVIADSNTLYKEIYYSTSYTHDSKSNLPPRKEIYEFYQSIVDKVKLTNNIKDYSKKIYISRRTWINKDLSNIGTNYTTRRKLVNEDLLVRELEDLGYKEVFTENLSTIDKILMFSNAESIIGAIGGGLCNVLFSGKNTKLIAIISPTFLDVNNRFQFSFTNVNTIYFNDTSHIEEGEFKKYMRVKYKDIIGEVENINNDELIISYVDQRVAGWNNDLKKSEMIIKKESCKRLDDGLNSPWLVNIDKLKKYLINE